MNDIPTKNTGVIEGSGTKSLWIGGTIPYEVVIESGDWRPFLVTGEKQFRLEDFMDCVTFSDLNAIEIQNKQRAIDVNYSDRFTAKMSGTTHDGNYLDKVADSVRLDGVVKEEEYPTPDNATWDIYYAPIPQDVINKAVRPNIAYEGIPTDKATLLYHLKQCPIQITIPAPHPNHAVVLVAIEGDTAFYFDSYPGTTNYLKTIDLSLISYALKIVLKKDMTNAYIVKNGSEYAGALPLTAEAALVSFLLNVGIEPPKKADGSLDFDKLSTVIKVVTL